MRRALLLALVAGMLGGAAAAQRPTVVLAPMACIPPEDNTLVAVAVSPPPELGEVRAYFRREGFGDFYYLPLDVAGEGAYWSVLPLPEPGNHAGEIFAAVVDEEGNVVAASNVQVVPVLRDCVVELEPRQRARADQLTVGETVRAQMGRTVAWWRCEGIVQRVDHLGALRHDELCAPRALWFPLMLAAGAITTVISLDDEPEREISPARP